MNYIRKRYFILLFVLLVLLTYSIVKGVSSSAVDKHLADKTQQIFLEYKTIYNNNHKIADLIFETEIDKSKIIELFKNREREELYAHLLINYKKFRSFSVRQLHFHLPNNDSFLRMHRPTKFGDNLTKARLTVKYVNDSKKRIDGFEEGRVFNGFRFVYPLFDATKHIGSVEVSFSALSFIKELESNYKIKSNFLIDKSVVDEKVFKHEKSNYVQSPIPQYYFQKSILDHININLTEKKLSKERADSIHTQIQEGKPFSIYDKKFKQIVTLIPMVNPISKRVTAALTFRSNDVLIEQESEHALFAALITSTIFALVLLLIFKELKSRALLYQKIDERTKELLLLNEKLNEMAHVDPLTGAYNRRYFYDISKKILSFTRREKQPLTIAMIDIDKFKDVNDNHGHDIGDEVLITLVNEVKNSIRESDVFVRYGGEEFILMLPNTDLEHALVITQKLRSAIESCDKVENLSFTISIGVAAFNYEEDDIGSLIKKSDKALYEAKNSGRNRVVCSEEI
ncbi:MAG: diguanylate cyclase [Campylobacterota bacterium]|nr:diguanylate cyclase [Campylobacterota bacterium]